MSETAFLILIAFVALLSIIELILGLRGVNILDKRSIGLSIVALLLTIVAFVFGPKPVAYFFLPAAGVKCYDFYMTCKIYSLRKRGR